MIFNFMDPETVSWCVRHENSENFINVFRKHFDSIRGYHCTKLFNENDFKQGVFPGNDNIIKMRAKQIFANDPNNIKINQIIDEYHISELGELHFFVVKKAIDRAYTYCLFGSEELIRIANKIESCLENVNARIKTIHFGKPVILHLNVPVLQVEDNEILIIQEIIQENDIQTIKENDFIPQSLLIKDMVKEENILNIEYVDHDVLIRKAIVDGLYC